MKDFGFFVDENTIVGLTLPWDGAVAVDGLMGFALSTAGAPDDDNRGCLE